ncbi:alkene reductase [Oceanobacillus oncorhynchi subsp. incaldanensis]|uniref:N-ethylmaleimide reductase n=2 Tax=Oceanobacillus TaxID=182709 RepID=A0A0A1ME46_9BACI|nr:alkene reductase [Oceanobacillus oncorhynchi]MDM8101503.1 alkene reductase [Oceanobacillus oncorhynchi]GIO17302.1 alkene reductase [Oceanobacillus oncorhynchi subsp. incaldanensis]CEI83650.1 N-ethylmaleimide reductase [Oceanobacillus oncorhynchi]
MTCSIFSKYKIGNLTLDNRIVMAPMTRGFADNETGEVNYLIADYYGKRARYGAGLIITEGVAINKLAKGTYGIPGIYTHRQILSWKKVTREVHQYKTKIFAQLWHVGRVSHQEILKGNAPVAPSPIGANGHVHRLRKPFQAPRALNNMEIYQIIADYKDAAKNAMEAGFDGVEIHAAHGYLIDQFINEKTNDRQDEFGGSLQNRLRFLDLIIKEVKKVVPKNRISIRISEKKDDDKDYVWEHPEEMVCAITGILSKHQLKIVHPSAENYGDMLQHNQKSLHELFRQYWDKTLIAVGNIAPEKGASIIGGNQADLVAFGQLFIANPDLVVRLKANQEIFPYQTKNLHTCLI